MLEQFIMDHTIRGGCQESDPCLVEKDTICVGALRDFLYGRVILDLVTAKYLEEFILEARDHPLVESRSGRIALVARLSELREAIAASQKAISTGANEAQEDCEVCGGDGKETCTNPDHGFLDALSFHDIGRIGCPVCGHDPKFKVKNGGICESCSGTGKQAIRSNPTAVFKE